MDDEDKVIVVDNGGGTIKAGVAGEDSPKAVFPSVVGRHAKKGESVKSILIGEEAQRNHNLMNLNCPIEQGLVSNWDDMEHIWHHTFYSELKIRPEEHIILLTEPPLNPNASRERITQIMFETFNFQGFYLHRSATLALFASGKLTGVVLESGDGHTDSTPVYEGNLLPHAIRKTDIAGRDLTDFLVKSLCEKGYSLSSFEDRENVKIIKESLCFVSQDFESEMEASLSKTNEKNYSLPDGKKISLGNGRFNCAEALFQPSLMGMESPGVHEIVSETIFNTDIDIRSDLYQHIVLAGGSTMFPGFTGRLKQEVESSALLGTQVIVHDPKERNISSWIGGSIIGSHHTFDQLIVTKEEYGEFGPGIVNRKCFS